MSIDAKEWADTFLKQHCRNIGEDASTRFSSAVQFHVDLCRAVIADELPNIAKAVMNTPLDKMGDLIECETFAEAKAPQPVPAGDVPEWLAELWKRHFPFTPTSGSCVIEFANCLNSELSRRVAEATAAKGKRIAELEAEVATLSHPAKTRYTRGVKSLSHILFLKTKLSDAKCEIVYVKDQLAASQAEVSRLTKLNETPRSFDEAVHGVQSMIDAMGSMGRNREEITKLREENARLKEANAEHLKQRLVLDAEVARLSRPVEGVDWKAMWKKYFETPGFAHECLRRIVEPILQAERNAREAAETERDELREFVRTKSVWSSCFGPTVSFRLDNRGHNIPDAELDRLLAEFRAEKGKVGA